MKESWNSWTRIISGNHGFPIFDGFQPFQGGFVNPTSLPSGQRDLAISCPQGSCRFLASSLHPLSNSSMGAVQHHPHRTPSKNLGQAAPPATGWFQCSILQLAQEAKGIRNCIHPDLQYGDTRHPLP